MNSSYEMQRVEKDIQNSRGAIELADAVNRLRSNRDFKTIISNGYFEKEAVRLVLLKADPNAQSAASQARILTDIDGIGSLSAYLNNLVTFGEQARKNLPDHEELRDTLLIEEAGE